MFLATLGLSVLLGRLGRGRAFLAIPAAIALVAGGSWVVLATGAGWIYPTLWLLRGASEFLLGLAVWGLAGLVTDTRQAKRFFPLIGGAAVLGQVLAGLGTRPLARWLGAENLILVWLGTLARGRRARSEARRGRGRGCSATATSARRRRSPRCAKASATRCARRCSGGCRWGRSCSRSSSSRSTSPSPAPPSSATRIPTTSPASSACSWACRPP